MVLPLPPNDGDRIIALKVSRRGQISPFIVMDMMRAANLCEVSGEDVLHLEVGQPGTSAPAGVLEAARQVLADERLGYTDAFGLTVLRQRVADHYKSEYAVEISPERIAVTTGSSGAFVLSFLAAFDPGDRVAVASPGYPAYRNILSAFGIEVVDLFVGPETNFQPTAAFVDRFLKKSNTRVEGLIAASPSNPTGTMIEAEELQELVEICRDHNIRLVSDEIYHGITYGKRAETVLAFTDDAIVINSFSKYYSMTGWRLGWLVIPEDLLRPVECLAQNLFISPPSLSQHAAIAAFECTDELEANVKRYAANRKLLLEHLPKAGFNRLASSDGAFYIYADIAHLTNNSDDFCKRMLAEISVAATPGIDFDPVRGKHFLRFSFAGPTNEIAKAVQRLREWNR